MKCVREGSILRTVVYPEVSSVIDRKERYTLSIVFSCNTIRERNEDISLL